MSSQASTIANLTTCFDSIESLASTLSTDDLATQSLCPAWDVRGVLGHVVGIEHALTGWAPKDADTPVPFDKIAPYEQRLVNASPEELTDAIATTLAARKADLATFSEEQFGAPSMTPIGPAT